jgi:uncharacterized protein with von Willebrand factor type A (vWA) domain
MQMTHTARKYTWINGQLRTLEKSFETIEEALLEVEKLIEGETLKILNDLNEVISVHQGQKHHGDDDTYA